MTEKYLDDVIMVHLKAFREFFLTFLGERFLRLYYKGILRHERAIKLVYIENDMVKGFVVGTTAPAGFYSSLLKRDWLRFGIASIPAICKKPKSISRLLRALTKGRNTSNDESMAELSSLAVLPDSRCKGIGRDLVNSFLCEVKRRGGKTVYLTTDKRNNDRVNAFYEKNGFRIRRVIETPEKRLMNEFWFDIQ